MNSETFKNDLFKYLAELKLPGNNNELLYKDYLSLPVENRSDDEQNIVDMRLTVKLLELLGYSSTDWVYNKIKDKNRPDFVIKVKVRVVFFIEDKRTSLELDQETGQIKRYLESVANIGLIFNGHEIIGVRRVVGETIPLFRLDFRDTFKELRVDGQIVFPVIEQDAITQRPLSSTCKPEFNYYVVHKSCLSEALDTRARLSAIEANDIHA